MAEHKSTISLCLIVKNEAKFISECLSHARSFCDEMLVVDTGSTDGTRELARDQGARVTYFEWCDDFAAARNAAIAEANCDWILFLDADERIDSEGWKNIAGAIHSINAPDCFDLCQINYSFNASLLGFQRNELKIRGFENYPGYTVSWLTRLFKKNPSLRFKGAVHEHLCRDGNIVNGERVPVMIHHHGQALSHEEMSRKRDFYYQLGIKKIKENPHDAKAIQELGVAAWELAKYPEAEMHFRKAVCLNSRDIKSRLSLGTVLQLQGKLEDASAVFSEIIRDVPEDLHAHGALGCSYLLREMPEEAIREFKKQIRINPDFEQARLWLADAYGLRRKMRPETLPTLSVCYIVKNEADCLGRSLENVKPHADEIIVADTGSTDATVAIAKSLGAHVANIGWRDDFSWARNQSLSHATSEWILVLDADEILSDDDWRKMKAWIQNPASETCFLVQTTYCDCSTVLNWKPNTLNIREASGYKGYFESPLVRLFRNTPRVSFSGSVHEHAHHDNPSVQPAMTDIRIHHYGKFREPSRMDEKYRLYHRIGIKKLSEMPNESHAYYELGVQLMELKEYDKVEEYFKKSLELDPRHGDALMAYGSFLFERHRHAEALDVFMRLIAVRPNDPQSYIYTASLLAELGKFELALRLLTTARELGGESVSLLLNEGVVNLRLSHHVKAEELFRKAYAINPDFPPILLNLALALAARGDEMEAEKYLRRAVEINPAYEAALQKHAEILFVLGRREESLNTFLKLHEIKPEDPDVIAQIILNLHFLKNYEWVRRYEEKLTRINPDNLAVLPAWKRIVRVYEKSGDDDGLRRIHDYGVFGNQAGNNA